MFYFHLAKHATSDINTIYNGHKTYLNQWLEQRVQVLPMAEILLHHFHPRNLALNIPQQAACCLSYYSTWIQTWMHLKQYFVSNMRCLHHGSTLLIPSLDNNFIIVTTKQFSLNWGVIYSYLTKYWNLRRWLCSGMWHHVIWQRTPKCTLFI